MKKALLILAEGFEAIEAVTPVNTLRRAGVDVTIAGLDSLQVASSKNIIISADLLLKNVLDKEFDMLILPGGGKGAENLRNSPMVLELVQKYNRENKYIAAICAAPTVLQTAGILKGHAVTSYPGMEGVFDKELYSTEKVVESGNIITSRGPGTSMDFAFALVRILLGDTKAKDLAKEMIVS